MRGEFAGNRRRWGAVGGLGDDSGGEEEERGCKQEEGGVVRQAVRRRLGWDQMREERAWRVIWKGRSEVWKW